MYHRKKKVKVNDDGMFWVNYPFMNVMSCEHKNCKAGFFFKLVFTNTLGMRYENGQGLLLQVTVILILLFFLYSILLKTDRPVKLFNQ